MQRIYHTIQNRHISWTDAGQMAGYSNYMMDNIPVTEINYGMYKLLQCLFTEHH